MQLHLRQAPLPLRGHPEVPGPQARRFIIKDPLALDAEGEDDRDHIHAAALPQFPAAFDDVEAGALRAMIQIRRVLGASCINLLSIVRQAVPNLQCREALPEGSIPGILRVCATGQLVREHAHEGDLDPPAFGMVGRNGLWLGRPQPVRNGQSCTSDQSGPVRGCSRRSCAQRIRRIPPLPPAAGSGLWAFAR